MRRPAVLCAVLCLSACFIPYEMMPTSRPAMCQDLNASAGEGLRWYGPAQSRDIRLNRAWCETVAPPRIVLGPGRPFETWGRGDTLTVLTWNMNVGGGDLMAFLEEELRVDCDRAAAVPQARPFVLLLQEVYRRVPGLSPADRGPTIPVPIEPNPRPGAQVDIESTAARCGLALVYVPSARNGYDPPGRIPEDKGNAILSSVRLSDPIAIELPFEAGRKVAVAATVRGPEQESLRVVSVHLDVTSTLWRTLRTANGTRLRQISGLTDALERIDTNATLVGGDFNTWSVQEGTLAHMERDFPDVELRNAETRGSLPADHIFFRAEQSGLGAVEGSYRVFDDAYLSDHRARSIGIVSTR